MAKGFLKKESNDPILIVKSLNTLSKPWMENVARLLIQNAL